ncbi:PH domain-containing protein [Streptomyces luteolus]|uniref:PH domain-containing protein n=1 Tax=Streptomyces luteolus TaxID=3043615 RepID=A0ABT6SZR1_9ACTN|nr:PH domain-containing protein [Streptomyces sp. B-S-A12]MDI3421084.1 PH domain-containing protein [Streptomyces sp. B-S-A12]
MFLVCTLMAVAMGQVGSRTGAVTGTRIAFGGLALMCVGAVVSLVLDHRRTTFLGFDETGIRLRNRHGTRHIPWHSLGAVGFHWTRDWRGLPTYTLELCPAWHADPDDPVLRDLIRDDEPLHPGLPRLRFRIPANATRPRTRLHEAFQRYLPHLYFGLVERERGYGELPDLRGHRERTRAARNARNAR